ncbi:hypothetical protein NPIL_51841 [Nephila pilipes]|uniref:Uncharacterized protein n=1 Tax=Nephila pilipes TaxID=299642 RepID=A0A8X6IKT7_NEPPI|nr:hypothetical protein NPIL_51841 [Nephila pilipes]
MFEEEFSQVGAGFNAKCPSKGSTNRSTWGGEEFLLDGWKREGVYQPLHMGWEIEFLLDGWKKRRWLQNLLERQMCPSKETDSARLALMHIWENWPPGRATQGMKAIPLYSNKSGGY